MFEYTRHLLSAESEANVKDGNGVVIKAKVGNGSEGKAACVTAEEEHNPNSNGQLPRNCGENTHLPFSSKQPAHQS